MGDGWRCQVHGRLSQRLTNPRPPIRPIKGNMSNTKPPINFTTILLAALAAITAAGAVLGLSPAPEPCPIVDVAPVIDTDTVDETVPVAPVVEAPVVGTALDTAVTSGPS